MWRKSDVIGGKNYRIQLCQGSSGERDYKLLLEENYKISEFDKYKRLVTQVIDRADLLSQDIVGIAQKYRLDTGDLSMVDVHGVWLTEAESAQLNSEIPFSEITWSTPCPPKFAPR